MFDCSLSTGLVKALPRTTRRPCSDIGDQVWLVESGRHTLPDGAFGGLSARHGRPGGGRPPQVTRNRSESSRGAWYTLAATATGSGLVKSLYGPRGRMRVSVYKEPGTNYLTRTGGLKPILVG